MNTKTLTKISTYLGYMGMVGFLGLMPGFSSIEILSWSISAVFLGLMPWGTWVKTRVFIELLSFPKYYEAGLKISGWISYLGIHDHPYNYYNLVAFSLAIIAKYVGIGGINLVLRKHGFFKRIILT